jgi:hypothetical protein
MYPFGLKLFYIIVPYPSGIAELVFSQQSCPLQFATG